MPSDAYSAGMFFFMNISMNCTRAAMTRMKTTVCMYSILQARRSCWIGKVTIEAIPITSVTAIPMPFALSRSLETPRNGQMPRNCASG